MKILRQKMFAEGEHSKKVRKTTDKIDTGLTIATHGTFGAGLGYGVGGKKGAIIGGALGSGAGYVKDRTSKSLRRHNERQGKKVKEPEEAKRTAVGNFIVDAGTIGMSALIGRELGGDIKLRRELEKAKKLGYSPGELVQRMHRDTGRVKGKKIGALVGVGIATNDWAKRKALKKSYKKDKEDEKNKENKK